MRSGDYKALAALVVALVLCAAVPPARAAGHEPHGEAAADLYSCPMHPEVRSKKKGRCPDCKMDLRPARAQTAAAPAESGTAGAHESRAESKMSIPDVELLDQDGRAVRFYTDLVKGKVVAVNFIFTTCTTICPPLGATFARVQRELGARAGRDVHFISISVDPATDTPARLKEYAAKFHAGKGWTFLTGKKENLDWALYKLGQYVEEKESHKTVIIVGNEATGLWKKALGMAKVEDLIQIVESVVNDKGVAAK